jgi:hypothetical protein
MLRELLRVIFRRKSEDEDRIAFLMARMGNLEYEKDTIMARVEELSGIVTEVGAVVDAVIVHYNEMVARLAAVDVEDPAIGAAVDTLASVRDRLKAFLQPPAPEPAPVVEEPPVA